MKKNPISKIVILSFLFLLFSAKANAQASCSYAVSNGKTCLIDVTVDFYVGSTLCKSVTLTNISPGSFKMTSCTPGCSGSISDVVVTLIKVGGVSTSGLSADNGTYFSPNVNGTSPACSGSPATSSLAWSGSNTTVGN